MLRILIASPHPALRAGLHVLLEEAQRARAAEPVMVVGEADTIEASLQWTRATQPQVVLYDLAFEVDEDLPGLWRLRTQSRGDGPGPSLTPRESEVLRQVAAGQTNKSIALKLGISEHTVKFHLGSAMAKLGSASRAEAVAVAIRRGLISV